VRSSISHLHPKPLPLSRPFFFIKCFCNGGSSDEPERRQLRRERRSEPALQRSRAGPVFQECVSEFISFITSEASDKCQREKRKTINGDDLLWGDTKGSAKGGESSAKKDVQPSPKAQVMICGFVCA
ncbi:hypothetical protein CMV_019187, partial [Castanea mollissima]